MYRYEPSVVKEFATVNKLGELLSKITMCDRAAYTNFNYTPEKLEVAVDCMLKIGYQKLDISELDLSPLKLPSGEKPLYILYRFDESGVIFTVCEAPYENIHTTKTMVATYG